MKDMLLLKNRYKQDPPQVQVGGLASNLSRISWLMNRQDGAQKLGAIFRESKHFAEWAAEHTPIEVRGALAEVQIDLALWERRVIRGGSLEGISKEPEGWSRKLLAMVELI